MTSAKYSKKTNFFLQMIRLRRRIVIILQYQKYECHFQSRSKTCNFSFVLLDALFFLSFAILRYEAWKKNQFGPQYFVLICCYLKEPISFFKRSFDKEIFSRQRLNRLLIFFFISFFIIVCKYIFQTDPCLIQIVSQLNLPTLVPSSWESDYQNHFEENFYFIRI